MTAPMSSASRGWEMSPMPPLRMVIEPVPPLTVARSSSHTSLRVGVVTSLKSAIISSPVTSIVVSVTVKSMWSP